MSIETKCSNLLGAIKCSPGVGRKMVAIRDGLSDVVGSRSVFSMKRCCTEGEESVLESLPHDILIKILCGVDHDDLDQLVDVSTTIRAAALIAKTQHFAYKTPKKTCKFGTQVNPEEQIEFAELAEPPKAPKRQSRFSEKILKNVSVQLFA